MRDFQLFHNSDMLGALVLAGPAGNTFSGVLARPAYKHIGSFGLLKVSKHFALVVAEKYCGDIHTLRTGHAILTAGAGDRHNGLLPRLDTGKDLFFPACETTGHRIRL